MASWVLPFMIFLPFLGAAVLPFFPHGKGQGVGFFALPPPLLQLLMLLFLREEMGAQSSYIFSFPWFPSLGVAFSLRLDWLSLLFAALISGIGFLITLYALYYMHEEGRSRWFYGCLLAFNGSMMGVVLADNLLFLFVFWELTSLFSFLLIGHRFETEPSRYGATKALLITSAGGLALLLGFLLIYGLAGTFELDALRETGGALKESPFYRFILLLILVGAFSKSAQVPFHIWLPSAMVAPTPVTAYLHSATMVKAGIYLLARLSPVLGGTEFWTAAVTATGMATLLVGGVLAIRQTDLKALLAYSTISQLGLIVVLLGLGSEEGRRAATLHLLNHAVFKGCLFLVVGMVEHETGTRDLRRLGGLVSSMPLTTCFAVFASLSLAGLPPFGGFISKELFFEAILSGPFPGVALPFLAILAGGLTFLYSFIFCYGVFFGLPRRENAHPPREPAWGMLAPVGFLALLALFFGLYPSPLGRIVELAGLGPATSEAGVFEPSLWHGPSPALGMSLAAVGLGTIAFLSRRQWMEVVEGIRFPYTFDWLYDAGITGLNRLALRLRQGHMTGHLRHYLIYSLLALLAGVSLPFLWFFPLDFSALNLERIEGYELAMGFLIALGALGCCFLRTRVQILLSLGLVGALVSLFFVSLRAPDLALTQIMVESVTLILFLLAFRHLSSLSAGSSSFLGQLGDWGIGIAVGLMVTVLLLASSSGHFFPTIAPYYLENSYLLAGGRNVVNVILVDFRGYDTLGETTVLGVAALGIYAMARLGRRKVVCPPSNPPANRGRGWSRAAQSSPILQTVARITLHLMVLFSLYLLIRGHNHPGGGFIAGLLTSVAIILQLVAFDMPYVIRRLPRHPLPAVVLGLTLASLTGLGAVFFGKPFLTSAFGHLHLPLLGEVEVASASLFDLGVYIAVVGTTLTAIYTIAEDPD